jgi:hypothetical protein
MALSAAVKNMSKWAAGATLLMSLFGCSSSSNSNSNTQIRAADMIYSGTAAFTNQLSGATTSTALGGALSYGGSSYYYGANSGTNTVIATMSNTNILTATPSISSGDYYTAVLFGKYDGTSPSLQILQDDRTLPNTGNTRLRVIHAASDLAGVDIYRSGTDVTSDSTYENTGAVYNEFTAGTYTFYAYPTGTQTGNVLSTSGSNNNTFTLNSGQLYTLFITEISSGVYSTVLVNDSNAYNS